MKDIVSIVTMISSIIYLLKNLETKIIIWWITRNYIKKYLIKSDRCNFILGGWS